MHSTNRKIYEFDGFRLDVFERRLLKGETSVAISPKAFDLLVALVENSGSLIERESLYMQVWPDSVVEDANLNVHISTIRKALEDPSCISTVSGHGYRFNWSVEELNGRNGRAGIETDVILPESVGQNESGTKFLTQPPGDEETPIHEPVGYKRAASNKSYLITGILGLAVVSALSVATYIFYSQGSASQITSIAVMPFVNDTGDPDIEYLSDGITETLIGHLSQLSGLSVKAPTSVFRYKGKNVDVPTVGRELNVRAILNGRVVQRGDELTLFVSLVDPKTENQVWGKQYFCKIASLGSIQIELARDVAENLHAKVSAAEELNLSKSYTPHPEAHQLYLKGRFHWNKRPRKHSLTIEYFSRAVALDPNYALAYSGLADAYADTGSGFSRERLLKAREAAEKALNLDDRLSEAHASLGNILLSDYDFPGAERELKRAIELNPNNALAHHWYAVLFRYFGRFDEAIDEHRRAVEIEPFLPLVNNGYGRTLLAARRYDDAIAQFNKVIELHPENVAAFSGSGIAYAGKGDHAQFAENFARFWEGRGLHEFARSMRMSFAADGLRGALRDIVRHGKDGHLLAYDTAGAYSWLGDQDSAFGQLDKSFERREPILAAIRIDPRFDRIREDPRYEELVRKIGFPER